MATAVVVLICITLPFPCGGQVFPSFWLLLFVVIATYYISHTSFRLVLSFFEILTHFLFIEKTEGQWKRSLIVRLNSQTMQGMRSPKKDLPKTDNDQQFRKFGSGYRFYNPANLAYYVPTTDDDFLETGFLRTWIFD